ncbi:MAG: HEAT repeat domain-containing protein [Bdellovibrionota bacterium]
MRLPWPFLFLLLCLALNLAPAFARDVNQKFTATADSKSNTCPEKFSSIRGEQKSRYNSQITFAPPPKELAPYVQALGTDLPAQAKELVELRIWIEQNGKKFLEREHPERLARYEALEWKNRTIGLIRDDIHGYSFLDGAMKFSDMSDEAKEAWVRKFSASNHPDARSTFHHLADQYQYGKLGEALRAVMINRGSGPSSTRILKILENELGAKNYETPSFVKKELMTMGQGLLEALFDSQQPLVVKRAVVGLKGRSNEFLANFIQHPSDEVKLAVIKNLQWEADPITVEAFRKILADPSPYVRREAVLRLQEFHEPAAIKLVKKLTRDPNSSVADAARELYLDYERVSLRQGRFSLFPIGKGENMDDASLLQSVLHGDSSTAKTNAYELRNRSAALGRQALYADDPVIRQQVAVFLADRLGPRKVAEVLIHDPVADVRSSAVQLLHRERDDPRVAALLKEALEVEEDSSVRASISQQLMEMAHEDGLEFSTSKMAKAEYLDAIRKEYGAGALREKDLIPLAAANHVYHIPEDYLDRSAEELVDMKKKFQRSTPLGYEVDFTVTDSLSGFKAGIYKSTTGTDATIVAVGGTQTLSDVAVDINMGVMQARSRNFTGLVKKIVAENKEQVRLQKSWQGKKFSFDLIPDLVVTGHSLGGGMSQVLGHDLAAAFVEAGLPEMAAKVRVVSWNGFGGAEPLKRVGRYSQEIVDSLAERSTNYYLPKDKVSRIGTHIGTMVPLPELKLNFLQSHKLGSLMDSFMNSGGLETTEARNSARYRYAASVSRVIGPLLDGIRFLRYKDKEWAVLKKLAYARLEWADQEGYKHLNPSFDWLKEELDTAAERLFGSGNRKQAQEFIAKIEEQRQSVLKKRRLAHTPASTQ